jgi:hypothetical protein
LLLCFLVVISRQAEAAVVKVESDFQTLRVGDTFEVYLTIDTQGELLNAAEIGLSYPAELLQLSASDTNESVVSIWLRDTNAVEKGKVTFSGVTPGGFSSANAYFLALTFTVLKEGQGLISASHAELLLHDGLGTRASSSVQNMHISIEPGPARINAYSLTDTEPPEDFVVSKVTDADLFGGKPFLVFLTTDKASGIDYYTVREGVFRKAYEAVSPYPLRSQTDSKRITVTAVDKVGNVREVTLYPQTGELWHQNNIVLGIIGVLCVLTLFLFSAIRRKRSLGS